MLSCPTPRPKVVLSLLFFLSDACHGPLDLDGLRDTVGFTRIDCLASLLDLLQHSLIGQRVLGRDVGGLCFEGDVVLLDACMYASSVNWNVMEVGGREERWVSDGCAAFVLRCGKVRPSAMDVAANLPSSFLSTRSTAPEQPPQLMLTLNL
jgi:hypothetical protein